MWKIKEIKENLNKYKMCLFGSFFRQNFTKYSLDGIIWNKRGENRWQKNI